MIRIAAVGDVHFGRDSAGMLRPHLAHLAERADVFALAGDLTKCGSADEAKVLAEEVADLDIPKVAVLGNHDYHADQEDKVTAVLEDAGVVVLEGGAHVITVGGCRVGVVGTKGFGGGFAGACGTAFGEPEMKAFINHTRSIADGLASALGSVDADLRVALLHYAPVEETLLGERLEIYPFLGSYLLAEAIDRNGAELVLHGHAHRGTPQGVTPGGVPVRNVAQPVIKRAYALFCLEGGTGLSGED